MNTKTEKFENALGRIMLVVIFLGLGFAGHMTYEDEKLAERIAAERADQIKLERQAILERTQNVAPSISQQ